MDAAQACTVVKNPRLGCVITVSKVEFDLLLLCIGDVSLLIVLHD